MRVLDFVRTIAELSEKCVDIYVNDELVLDSSRGLIFDAKLYMQLDLSELSYSKYEVYIVGNLTATSVSEAVAGGKYYADDKILLSCGTMYLVDGFEVKELLTRSKIKEMLNL